MRSSPAPGYSFVQRVAHWLIVGLCVSQFPTANAIQRTHDVLALGIHPSSVDLLLHKIHALAGWAALFLATILLMLRVFGGAAELSTDTTNLQRRIARIGHLFLYAGIVVLVITGTGTMYFSRRFAPVHILFTYLGAGLVFLHAAAALWHHFVRRDDVLTGILPTRHCGIEKRSTIDKAQLRAVKDNVAHMARPFNT